MTDMEKAERLATLISPDTASPDLLTILLGQAEGIVLNKRYPFGVPENATVPAAYEHIQIQIALELFTKMGAEGQVEHTENGISRKFEAADVSPSLLRRIVPLVGSVM
jgi:hypothetical protein